MAAIQFKRLDHIQLCIPPGQEPAARHFYADILGFEEIPKPVELRANGGLWYQVAGLQVHLGVEEEVNRSKRHPAFEVADVLAAQEYLAGHGVRLQAEIPLPGQRRFSFRDPFGNRIELLQKDT